MKTVLQILSEIRPEFDFANGHDFIQEGMLDSFDLITLVSALESNFSIRIDGVEILPENFSDMNAIDALVSRSRSKK